MKQINLEPYKTYLVQCFRKTNEAIQNASQSIQPTFLCNQQHKPSDISETTQFFCLIQNTNKSHNTSTTQITIIRVVVC